MSKNNIDFVSYTKEQNKIVESGIDAINKVLDGTNIEEKRSLLLCLDKYLDPYYGYNLPYADEIIILLEKQLFSNDDIKVKEDILELLSSYGKETLDYLAGNIENIPSDSLADALGALSNTYNSKYVPIFIRYENHGNFNVSNIVKEALIKLSKKI